MLISILILDGYEPLIAAALLFSLPLLGFIVGCARGGWRFVHRTWKWIIVYYGLIVVFTPGAFLLEALKPAACLVWASGPVLAVILVAEGLSAAARPPDYPCCDHCGYNLTGNVSGICPECGQPINAPPGT